MEIGLNILDSFKISIGDNIDSILDFLNKSKIEYNIPFKETNSNKSSYIIYIEKFGLELRLKNNKISYIKTTNSDLNYIMHIDNNYPALVLSEIKDKLVEKFGLSSKEEIYIDRFEAKTFNSVITIPYNKDFVKITLVMGKNTSIYIEKIELLCK